MDEPGFRARRRADKEERENHRQARLGHLHGLKNTIPLVDGQDDDDQPAPIPPALPGKDTAPKVPGTVDPLPPPKQARRKMNPELSIMLGPILRYDNVVKNVYHGFALLVTNDQASNFSPRPTLTYEWDTRAGHLEHAFETQASLSHHSPHLGDDGVESRTVEAQRIYVFQSRAGPMSFWRFKLEIPLGERQNEIFYSVNNGPENAFFVPAFDQNMRWVANSCNGFSAGVDTAAFNGASPLWSDVLRAHEANPIHVLVQGGDQIYCDPVTREAEIESWITEKDEKKKIETPLSYEASQSINNFYFNHYCKWFRSGSFGKAIQRIPMLNQADDHDLIDGWGSYPDNLMSSPVFSAIGTAGLFWFSLFQTFIADDVDGTDVANHTSKSIVFGGPGRFVPYPSKSFVCWLGPQVSICLLDTRTERCKASVVSSTTYERVFAALHALPPTTQHLVLLLGVPIAYPRMTAIETVLDSKLNPLTILGKSGAMGLSGFVNKFNKEAELLDDLNDHWCAGIHKKERNWLVEEMQKLAVARRLRVTYLSGDVHAACVSKFETVKHKDPRTDPKYQLQVITSAIVNTPPPPAVLLMVSTLGRKRHKTLHHINTDEELLPMFERDTDGKKYKTPTIMGRRNYCVVDLKPDGGLTFDLRVETQQGAGTTVSYAVTTPAPGW